MTRKTFLKVITVTSLAIGINSICTSNYTHTVNAASWGAKTIFTTPKATRGTWYYKEDGKIKHCKITAHTLNGIKLYKVLSEKEFAKWDRKLEHQSLKKYRKSVAKLDKTQLQAYTFKWHGITSFNSTSWLAGAGNGIYHVPVTKTRNGKKVKALRLGYGAGNYFDRYGYRTRKLAK